MKKILSFITAAAIAITCLAGCAGTGDTPNPTDSKETEAPVATQAPSTDPTAVPTPTPEPTPTPVPTPTPDPYVHKEYTTTKIFDFTDKANGAAQIDGADGWNFGEKSPILCYKDGMLSVSEIGARSSIVRINLTTEQRQNCTAEIVAQYDAVGFYIENNTDETIGLCYFGEIKNEFGEHQQMYFMTIFDDLEVYLLDTEGNMKKGTEYAPIDITYENRGLTEVPAHFKGYFIVALTSLGCDNCFYGSWGEHSIDDCENGLYTKSSGITNVGFSIYTDEELDDAEYIIGEYILVDFK